MKKETAYYKALKLDEQGIEIRTFLKVKPDGSCQEVRSFVHHGRPYHVEIVALRVLFAIDTGAHPITASEFKAGYQEAIDWIHNEVAA